MKTIVLLFSLFFVSETLIAQEVSNDSIKRPDLYVIIKHNGSEYIGSILSDDGREVLIETEALGKIYIPKSDIKSMVKAEPSRNIVHGEYRSEGPFTTRYAFTNNAHPIKKGENYSMVNIYGPEVHFAVSNHFNIGLMSTWIASPLVLAMKYSLKTKDSKINFSVGTLVGTSGYLNRFRSFGGLNWLSMTIGDRMNNFTVSGGYGYYHSGSTNNIIAEGIYTIMPFPSAGSRPLTKGPLASVAGICKVGSRASFVFDSMVFFYKSTESNVETILVSAPDYYSSPSRPAVYQYWVKNTTIDNVIMLLMPGMRFQNSDKSAFQLSLSGVSIFGKTNRSFPFPMASWFQKF